MEPKSREQLVKDVRGIIQFALTVAIFFESFLVTFSPGNENALLWGLAVAFYIADYLLSCSLGPSLASVGLFGLRDHCMSALQRS